MSTTASTIRRSSRLKSKQTQKEQEAEEEQEQEELSVEAENEEQHESGQTSEAEEEEEDYATRLRPRRASSNNVDQDMSNLEGDSSAEYKDGDCVWAKYQDYPWWPAQVEINAKHSRRRKKAKRSTITVRWFGDFPVKTNVCKLINVISWDPDDGDRIFVDVNEEDVNAFQDSMDSANNVYLTVCEERGCDPIQSALDYQEKNASRDIAEVESEEEDNDDTTSKKQTKKTKKDTKKTKKNTKKTGSVTKSRRKKKVEKAEEEADDDALVEAPALEPISDESDLNERQRSLRSAKQSRPKEVETPAVNQRKSVRKRGRKKKLNDEKEDKESTTKAKAGKNKRGRKRKYEEAMNGDQNDDEEEDNDEDIDIDMEDEKESDEKEKKVSKKRRSNRVQAKKQISDEEEEDDENEENDDANEDINNLYPESELRSRLDAAWNMCEATHSATDFTPWIALFYFGIRRFNNNGDKDKDVTNTVANIFHLEEDQVLNHLSEFTELAAKKSKNKNKTNRTNINPRKKRKGN